MQVHRGRLLDHVHLVVTEFDEAKHFYRAILEVLGVPVHADASDHFWADELFVSTPSSRAARGVTTGRVHLAFQATSRDMVDQFHRTGIAAGGRDHGAPAERPYHPGYYAAFLLDPAGNNIEAVFHGPAKRSANSVVITF